MEQSISYRDPVRNVNQEYLANPEIVSNKVYPLPGATFDRVGEPDKRLQLSPSNIQQNNKVTYFEHIATVYHRPSKKYFVAFRETMDALYARQTDMNKYPAWLMDSERKKSELKIYIYMVRESSPGVPIIPSKLPTLSTHEDWLVHIGDGPDWVFDTVSYFLLKCAKVLDDSMYHSIAR